MQIGFQTASGNLGAFQEFFNARDGTLRDGGAGLDGLIGAIEVVPGDGVDVGPEHEVGVALPTFELMLLGGADRARNDLKDVGWCAAMAILNADRDAEDEFGAKLTSRLRGNRGDQATVNEAARSNIDRLEQTWESAARANGVFEVAVGEDDRLTIIKVSCDDRERDAQIFKMLGVENAIDQVAKAMVAGEAQARNAPAADVAEFEGAASRDDSRQRGAAGVGRAENAANAGARDARNGDVMLLENLKNAEMRKATRKSAAESDSDAWPSGQWRLTEWSAMRFTYHARSIAIPRCGER